MSDKELNQLSKSCPECGGRGWVDNRCLTEDHSHRCTHAMAWDRLLWKRLSCLRRNRAD